MENYGKERTNSITVKDLWNLGEKQKFIINLVQQEQVMGLIL